jgi:hypothetical protein
MACVATATDPSTCLNTDCDLSNGPTAALVACSQGSCNNECFGGQNVCDPQAGDGACQQCIKGPSAQNGCCDELTTCSSDPECVQCLGCVSMNSPIMCVQNGTCSFTDPETSAFLQCGQTNCATACGG